MLRDLEESQLSIEQIADKYCVCKTPELKDLLITSLKVFKDNIKKKQQAMSNITAINKIIDIRKYIRDNEESSITASKVLDWLVSIQRELENQLNYGRK